MIINTIIFFIFAFIGWVLDSSYCSLVNRKIVISGYFKYLPFCSIYGFGGLLITSIFIELKNFFPLVTILLTTLAIVLLEYVGGWFCDKILKERLWDYSKMKYNLNGYINLLHSFYWFLLVSLTFVISSPYIEDFENILFRMQMVFSSYDIYFSVVFLTLTTVFTIYTRNKRIKKYLLRIRKEFSFDNDEKK